MGHGEDTDGEEQQQSGVTGLHMGVGHITPAQSVAT